MAGAQRPIDLEGAVLGDFQTGIDGVTGTGGTTPLNRGYAASARAGERGCLGGRPRRWGATQAGSGT